MKTGKERKIIRKLKKSGRGNIYRLINKLGGHNRGRPNKLRQKKDSFLLTVSNMKIKNLNLSSN